MFQYWGVDKLSLLLLSQIVEYSFFNTPLSERSSLMVITQFWVYKGPQGKCRMYLKLNYEAVLE